MIVQEMINQIRDQLHDITEEYTDEVLIKYINTAIKSASDVLINVNSSLCLIEKELADGDDRPFNFRKFAGVYPIRFTNGKVEIVGATSPYKARYFVGKDNIKAVGDELPFTDETVLQYIEQYASILAFNRNEYNVNQDSSILDNLKTGFIENVGVE